MYLRILSNKSYNRKSIDLYNYIQYILFLYLFNLPTCAWIYLLYRLLFMTHITNKLAQRIPRLSTRIRVARNNSPGPGPVQAASDVSLRQQLLLLNAGASKIVCLCSIFSLVNVFKRLKTRV